ncbi:MAG: hypothetical protein EBS54_08055, partial [Betaproteobacteria bacterium]|nr:hypothetical protein [Betaproteobacteria bacterium]
MERASLESAHIEPIEIPPFLRRGPSIDTLIRTIQDFDHMLESLERSQKLLHRVGEGIEETLRHPLRDIEHLVDRLKQMREKEPAAYRDLWGRAYKHRGIKAESDGPVDLIKRLLNLVAPLREPIYMANEILRELSDKTAYGRALAYEEIQRKQDQVDSGS